MIANLPPSYREAQQVAARHTAAEGAIGHDLLQSPPRVSVQSRHLVVDLSHNVRDTQPPEGEFRPLMTQTDVRRYQSRARSTETFGRVLCSARDQHLIVDGPVQNGCPGEAITPAELFLSGVAACGVELIQVLAKQSNVPLRAVSASIEATQDPSAPVRPDVNLFNTVRLSLELSGVSQEQGSDLVERFKRR
jgi:uncharacterized OsmC-like protein